MTNASDHLLAVGELCQLLLELVGMAYQLQLKITEDGTYKLTDEEAYNARRLTRQADGLLSKLGGDMGGGGSSNTGGPAH